MCTCQEKKEKDSLIEYLRTLTKEVEFWKEQCEERKAIIKDYQDHIQLLKKDIYGEEDE